MLKVIESSHAGSRYQRIGVVVPAHDEEETLAACLTALGVAASAVMVPVSVLVVLDACTDGSATITSAGGYGTNLAIDAITVDVRCVGAARQAGFDEYLCRHGVSGTWLATTDADSQVPPHWFETQLNHAYGGAAMVAGTVEVQDWVDYSRAVRRRAVADYTGVPHRHIHGANLAFSAEAYCASGGFRPVTHDEDVALVSAFRAGGEFIVWTMDNAVATSARRVGRAPNGFANYLAELEHSMHEQYG